MRVIGALIIGTLPLIIAIVIYKAEVIQNEENSLNAIASIDAYNCRLANGYLDSDIFSENNTGVPVQFFLTDLYFDNFNIIIEKFGIERASAYIEGIDSMNQANSLISLFQTASLLGTTEDGFIKYQSEIINRSSSTKKFICD